MTDISGYYYFNEMSIFPIIMIIIKAINYAVITRNDMQYWLHPSVLILKIMADND